MVKLHIKKGDESRLLYETTCDVLVDTVIDDVCCIFNGQLKVERICDEIVDLSKHGLSLPPQMQGLTEEQIIELKLRDEWGDKCVPSGGYVENKDAIGRRNGKAPIEKMVAILTRTVDEAKALVAKKLVEHNVCLTQNSVKEAIDILRGVMTIVYPMGLPPHEPIKMEFDNEEDLSGKQASQEVVAPTEASLWFAGKELVRGQPLSAKCGRNEKTKLLVKLTKRAHGAPAREPVVGEREQREMMAHYHRRQEELKRLDAADDDSYLSAPWASSGALKDSMHGLSNIKWGPR